MDLAELRERGRSTTLRGWITNPLRRLLWPLIAPYLAALLEPRIEERPRTDAERGALPQIDALRRAVDAARDDNEVVRRDNAAVRKDLGAVAHRLASLEDDADIPAPGNGPRGSYAQCGEDRIVAYLLRVTGAPPAIRYLDIGAALPVGDSNTFLFYRAGGSGVLVEADPAYIAAYAEARPRDAVEALAVVPSSQRPADGTIELLLAADRGWTSVLPDRIDEAARRGKGGLRQRITVPAATIGDILDRHFAGQELHLLSIDVEGLDEAILRDVDFGRHRPWVIVLETMGAPGPEDFLGERGYALYADTHVNRIFVRRDVLGRAVH